MHLLERPAVKSPQRRLPPAVVDLLLLALQCLFFLVFVLLGLYLLMTGSPCHALPLFVLAIAVNPFVKLPPFVWLGLVAFGLALS